MGANANFKRPGIWIEYRWQVKVDKCVRIHLRMSRDVFEKVLELEQFPCLQILLFMIPKNSYWTIFPRTTISFRSY